MKGLRELRLKLGLSQADLEKLTGIDANNFSRYERGIVVPSVEAAQKIAKALGVTVDELINGTSSQTWEIRLVVSRADNKSKGETIDMNGATSSAVLNISDDAMSITLSAGYPLWEDDTQFEALIEDLRRKRMNALKIRKEGW